MGARIAGAGARLMGGESLLDVDCDASVERAVSTLEQVDMPLRHEL